MLRPLTNAIKKGKVKAKTLTTRCSRYIAPVYSGVGGRDCGSSEDRSPCHQRHCVISQSHGCGCHQCVVCFPRAALCSCIVCKWS
uniref:Bm1028 n=1 Tax=Brugia malayi TaxID=6279 RepID=A0A0J9Y5N9_BRUMA|nr:Bm1028 [Brugia malayi]